jgi:hypothetical protein
MSKYKGNIVSATQTVLSGTSYTGQANGKFTLSEQIQARGSSLWAKGLGVPDAPTIGTATAANAQASVAFTAPSDTGGQTITGYTAKSNPSNITGTGTSSPITVTGLTNGTAYTFTVTATNVSGTSPSSSASNSITPFLQVAPVAPIMNSATKVTNNRATVNITAPSYTGASAITSYTITSSPDNITATSSTAGNVTINGLKPLTTYTFTATATNSQATSVASSVSNSITTSLALGDTFQGGTYGGKISTSANGNATHYLIVSPKATGYKSTWWGPSGVTTGRTSKIDGPANSAGLASLGSSYDAARFCEDLTIGGYFDWYLPAISELEVLYYFLKPTTALNNTAAGDGNNLYAVAPEPINTNYTTGSPTQTSVVAFQSEGAEAFNVNVGHYSSTEESATAAMVKYFDTPAGAVGSGNGKGATASYSLHVRAIRRVPV